jgi:TolA-binding protein
VALQEKNYDQAQSIFSKLSSQNTAEPGARAQYYLGLAYQDQNKYSDAIQAFSKVKVLYEAYANWVSEAMLHTAQCYKALNNPADETNTLKAIIHDYPGTLAAQEAQKLLKQK